MFCLSELEDTVRVPPSDLNLPLEVAIKKALQKLFLDKVLSIGLCVSIYGIKSIEGGFVLPGDGAATYKVVFRIVVFRPFVGEVIAAKFKESDSNGLRYVYVPAPLIPTPNRCEPDPYNRNQMRWVWKYGDDEFIIDDSCQIKFRVENISYPPVPTERAEDAKPFAPMVVTGTIDDDGLGPVSWWEACAPISDAED
ncbi:DNA-directed RNA polymerase III subunit RPC8-like isoform X2 [Brassica napus]|uniref:DNA-directed RNA polymerase III subunit RPC8-like isoform X2 n=1 Tax=Brassica oleracea var. oleracea TaxID=109376 RepID=UPI0006A6A565|nr:PREDICTED: DNA-directed RNA polymerase III subunit RPC8-like isoform X2 [Brassica oleracea var. oleracea]XP_048621588.1 DNA-directed RNA polymerase III subunit RPC8-like isoform X2 [Brassica napus]